MDNKWTKLTRRKFLESSGKVASFVQSDIRRIKKAAELIMPQEGPKLGIGHLYQNVHRVGGNIIGYGKFSVKESKIDQMEDPLRTSLGRVRTQTEYRWLPPQKKGEGGKYTKTKTMTRKMEYLGEIDLSGIDPDPPGPKYKMEGGQSHRQEFNDYDEITMHLNDQIDHEIASEQLDEIDKEIELGLTGEEAPEHPFDNDDYGKRIKKISTTARKLSNNLQDVHRLQDIAKKQIRSRSRMLLEHQEQKKQQQSQKKPSQVKQKIGKQITEAIDLAKESPKASEIFSGLRRFSAILSAFEIAGMNPFNPPKLGERKE